LEGGPPTFRQDVTCPALLEDRTCLTCTGLSPALARLSRRFQLHRYDHWPGPRSLATTSGVSVDVLSSGYLDVSLPRVRLRTLWIQIRIPLRVGCPIRKCPDQSLLAAPRTLSQRATSFIASQCQGIHQMPFLTLDRRLFSAPRAGTTPLAPFRDKRRGSCHATLPQSKMLLRSEQLSHPALQKAVTRRPSSPTANPFGSTSVTNPLHHVQHPRPGEPEPHSLGLSAQSGKKTKGRARRSAKETARRNPISAMISNPCCDHPLRYFAATHCDTSQRPQSGGGERNRTDDLMLAKHALSQLSYAPHQEPRWDDLVGQGGLEPPTSRLSSARSNQLSY
jgi:hypothetical protein